MRRSLLTYENVIAREVFGGSEAQAFWFVEDVKADMAELAQKLDEAGRTADARKVVIEQRDALITELEAKNAELRKVLEKIRYLDVKDGTSLWYSEAYVTLITRLQDTAAEALDAKP